MVMICRREREPALAGGLPRCCDVVSKPLYRVILYAAGFDPVACCSIREAARSPLRMFKQVTRFMS